MTCAAYSIYAFASFLDLLDLVENSSFVNWKFLCARFYIYGWALVSLNETNRQNKIKCDNIVDIATYYYGGVCTAAGYFC